VADQLVATPQTLEAVQVMDVQEVLQQLWRMSLVGLLN
jgi:hypothetical protein